MTFREEDMYPYVRRNLRRRYPASAKWKIYGKDRWEGYEPDFVVERKYRKKIERIIVEVKVTSIVSQSHVDQLNQYVQKLSGGNVKIKGKILVIPAGADKSIVSEDVEVMFLKSFKCEDDVVVWYE